MNCQSSSSLGVNVTTIRPANWPTKLESRVDALLYRGLLSLYMGHRFQRPQATINGQKDLQALKTDPQAMDTISGDPIRTKTYQRMCQLTAS